MKIDGKGSGPKPTERISAPQAPSASDTRPTPAAPKPTDRVEISALGRARNAQPVPAGDSDRLDQVRARLQSGFYESDEVQHAVARLIIARGDHRDS